MKSLKLLLLSLVLLLSPTLSFGQDLTYDEVQSSDKRPRGKYETYTSQDGTVYSVGETIDLGMPSGTNGKFVYIQKMDIAGTIYVVGSEATNTHATIKKIKVRGTGRSGWKVNFQTQGLSAVDNYFLNIDEAVLAGEVKTDIISSDEALKILKDEKTKLDLGLSTQEEFDQKVKELSKFIK